MNVCLSFYGYNSVNIDIEGVGMLLGQRAQKSLEKHRENITENNGSYI